MDNTYAVFPCVYTKKDRYASNPSYISGSFDKCENFINDHKKDIILDSDRFSTYLIVEKISNDVNDMRIWYAMIDRDDRVVFVESKYINIIRGI